MATNNKNNSDITPAQAALLSIYSEEVTGIRSSRTPMHAMRPDSAGFHIRSRSMNPVHDSAHNEETDKPWVQRFAPITGLLVRTRDVDDGWIAGDFNEAFLPEYEDERERNELPGSATRPREWRLETKANCEAYFRTEISGVVLAAWARVGVYEDRQHRPVLARNEAIQDTVDIAYTWMTTVHHKTWIMAIGAIKLREIDRPLWQSGDISASESQMRLSRELRGYAHQYQCPQIFCFDGDTLLLLQFRAVQPSQLLDDDCPVDCWAFPRDQSVTSLRDALSRLITQGWRHRQGKEGRRDMTVGGVSFTSREFYSGRPLWEDENGVQVTLHPGGWQRSIGYLRQFVWTMEGQRPQSEEALAGRFWD